MSNPWIRPERPLAIAHRGQSLTLPENTMPAYERAIELGAEMIEADVNISRDGALVLIHDTTLDRTTDGSGPVATLDWSELRRLDAGRWFADEFGGIRLPQAEDLLGLARRAGILLCLEVKGAGPVEAREIAGRLLELIVRENALETTFVSGYDHGALAAARKQVPALLLAPDRLPDNVPADPPEATRQATSIGAAVLQNHHRFTTGGLVRHLHDEGVAVWSWPTTDEASLVASLQSGADGLMGDDIETMARVLNRADLVTAAGDPPALAERMHDRL